MTLTKREQLKLLAGLERVSGELERVKGETSDGVVSDAVDELIAGVHALADQVMLAEVVPARTGRTGGVPVAPKLIEISDDPPAGGPTLA